MARYRLAAGECALTGDHLSVLERQADSPLPRAERALARGAVCVSLQVRGDKARQDVRLLLEAAGAEVREGPEIGPDVTHVVCLDQEQCGAESKRVPSAVAAAAHARGVPVVDVAWLRQSLLEQAPADPAPFRVLLLRHALAVRIRTEDGRVLCARPHGAAWAAAAVPEEEAGAGATWLLEQSDFTPGSASRVSAPPRPPRAPRPPRPHRATCAPPPKS